MAASTVNGNGNRVRSGAHALTLLATPLNAPILEALAGHAKPQAELRRETGSPAQTTLRTQLRRLTELGAVEKRRRDDFPGTLEYELTASGRELLQVAGVLADWIGQRTGSAPPDSGPARAATKALIEGWSSTMVRALAARPLSLTELDGVIASLSYPSLERRLGAMRLTGLVDLQPSSDRSKPFGATEWLRRGVAPLVSAARWERRHLAHRTLPLGRLDVEAILLLGVPLLQLPSGLAGACRMAAEIGSGDERRLAGITVEIHDGRVTSCNTRLRVDADSWTHGSVNAWLEAITEGDATQLEPGGDCGLAQAILAQLQQALYRPIAANSPVAP